MSANTKILSFEEVSKHNRKTDCWLIISGNTIQPRTDPPVFATPLIAHMMAPKEMVYDVTPFVDDHPGGYDVLLSATEKDATEDFETVDHSQDARDQMKDYYVGELENNTMPQENGYHPPSTTASASNQAPESSSTNILTFVLPILILILALALYYYPKKEMAI